MYANLNDVSWGTRSGPQSKNTTGGFFNSLKNYQFSGLCDIWNYILHGPQAPADMETESENPTGEETDMSDSDLTESTDMTNIKLSEDQDTMYSQYAVFGGSTVKNLKYLKRKQRRPKSTPIKAIMEPLPSPTVVPTDLRRLKSDPHNTISNLSLNQGHPESEQLIMQYNLRKLRMLSKPVEEETDPIPGLQPNENQMVYSWIPKYCLNLYSNLAITPYDLEHREINGNGSDLYSWITDDASAISEVGLLKIQSFRIGTK